MATRNTLEVLKQCFEEVVPRHDKRTTIAPLSFVVCLVYTYLGDSKTFSLEAIRRGMMHHLKTRISRSAFWERLARHRLQTLLQGVVAQLMGTLTTHRRQDKAGCPSILHRYAARGTSSKLLVS